MAGRDITEGRGDSSGNARSIAVDLGIVSSTSVWQNTSVAYDIALGGIPFFYAISDARPYIRQTAPFRKDQFDNGKEPGEQSLTGWWLRSQSSFHSGSGIKFYDPSAGETVDYRFADSKGVNVWTKGQVTLLKSTDTAHYTTNYIGSDNRPGQHIRSIQYNGTNGILLLDGYDVNKISESGVDTHFIDYAAGTAYKVYSICDDGINAYWVTKIDDSGVLKTAVYKKPLTGSSASTADETQLFKTSSVVPERAVMEYIKDLSLIHI